MGGKLGVMVEVNCETDFVARRPEFQELAKNIAMQIAASPLVEYISLQSIPVDIVEKEKEIESSKDDLAKKPKEIKEKIVEGRIQKR
jgi:elongation factor Ts